MGTVSITELTAGQSNVNAAEFNALVTPLLNEFNGSIDNSNIASDAAIVYSKLSLGGNVVNADISASAAIAFSKLASLTSAQILVGNGSNVAAAVAVSGDVTLDNAGATTVTDLTITSEARGDLLMRGASAWGRLAVGTSGQSIVSDGTDWTASDTLNTLEDYGTSNTTGTAKTLNNVIIQFGSDASIAGSGSQAITNLNFTDATSYVVMATTIGATETDENPTIVRDSGSQFTIHNHTTTARGVMWFAIGT